MRKAGLGILVGLFLGFIFAPIVLGTRLVLLLSLSLILLILGDKARELYLSFLDMRIEQEKRRLEDLKRRKAEIELQTLEMRAPWSPTQEEIYSSPSLKVWRVRKKDREWFKVWDGSPVPSIYTRDLLVKHRPEILNLIRK